MFFVWVSGAESTTSKSGRELARATCTTPTRLNQARRIILPERRAAGMDHCGPDMQIEQARGRIFFALVTSGG